MTDNLQSKTDDEILRKYQLFRTVTFFLTVLLAVALLYYFYSVFTRKEIFSGVYFGGFGILLFFLSSQYKKYDRERKRRNL